MGYGQQRAHYPQSTSASVSTDLHASPDSSEAGTLMSSTNTAAVRSQYDQQQQQQQHYAHQQQQQQHMPKSSAKAKKTAPRDIKGKSGVFKPSEIQQILETRVRIIYLV